MADKRSHAKARKPKASLEQPAMRVIKGLKLGDASSEFDKLIHERARLAIVSALAVHPKLAFSELKQLLEISDGNLSVHARKLEDAGYIVCTKTFEDRVPKTSYALTASGRRSLERYLSHMDALIRTVRGP